MLSNLVDTQVKKKQNRGLKTEEFILEKYITYKYKRACNLRKMCLLLKIRKRFSDVPGIPVIPHQAGLSAFKVALENRPVKKIPKENLIKRVDFVF